MPRVNDFYGDTRRVARQFWDIYHEAKELQAEYTAKGYGGDDNASPPIPPMPPGEGVNDGYTKDIVGAFLFDTINAVGGLMTAGHATNVAKLL